MAAEDRLRDQIAERDIGGAGNRPAALETAVQAEQQDQAEIEQGWGRHAADRRRDRQRRAPPGVQGAPWSGGFDDLLRGQREEEDHPDVVDQELEGVGKPLLAVEGGVGPDERDERTSRQGERRFDSPAERTARG